MNEIGPRLRQDTQTSKDDETGKKPSQGEGPLDPLAERIASELRADTISPFKVSALLRIGEFLGLAVIATAIMLAYVGLSLVGPYALAITAGSGLYVLLAEIVDGYEMRALRRPLRWLPRIALAWAATFALLALAGFLLKISGEFSRFWSGSWFLGGLRSCSTRLILSRASSNGCATARWSAAP
jgi:hypothetical protein